MGGGGDQRGSDYANTPLIIHMMKRLKWERPRRGCPKVLGFFFLQRLSRRFSGSPSSPRTKRCRFVARVGQTDELSMKTTGNMSRDFRFVVLYNHK